MREPYRKRRINVPPRFNNFKPSGVPRRFLKQIDITIDEYEALRLTDYLQLEHLEASERMNISRPTFTRLIEKARHKVAQAIVNGRELVIEGGNIDFINTLHRCKDCDEITLQPFSEESKRCPDCGSSNVENLAMNFMKRGRHRRGRFK
ncbi:MAG: DUF134 domain-containing protein [Ignavibacteria bacterium]|nr:DUF134 domain-containing protein [Ignavibacteria bacterium]